MNSAPVSVLSPSVAALKPFIEAGIFNDAEIQLATLVERLAKAERPDAPPEVILAVAAAARGPRSGHVRIELRRASELMVDESDIDSDLPWPEPEAWSEILRACDVVVATPDTADLSPIRPLVLDGDSVYLQRYWLAERAVAKFVIGRVEAADYLGFNTAAIEASLERFFGPETDNGVPNLQRAGAKRALRRPFSVLVGGPGTGKTRTIARMMAAVTDLRTDSSSRLRIALAAPSGKAAARMGEAIEVAVDGLLSDGLIDQGAADSLRDIRPTTIHKLLRANPRRGFGQNAHNRLDMDMVIIDETSMVSLPLMDALFEAVGPECHVVLVGDPDQLASVEAGTVLGDIVRAPEHPYRGAELAGKSQGSALDAHITTLQTAHRFGSDSGIAELATRIRQGETDEVIELLRSGIDEVTWVRSDDQAGIGSISELLITNAIQAMSSARNGNVDEALDRLAAVKVLAATRLYPFGRNDWSERIESGVFANLGPGQAPAPWQRWYVGRPVLNTRNDRLLGISNGDVGITIERDGVLVVAMAGNPDDRLEIQTARLQEVETWWAMTIHKSQGSEFDHVVVSLPPPNVPILTRELLYTAVTRAKERVTIVGSEDAIRQSVGRPISRASGLGALLWSPAGD